MTTSRILQHRKSSGKEDTMKKKEYIYIAVKLNKNGVPKIVDVFRKEEDANNAAYSGDGWGNVIKRELK